MAVVLPLSRVVAVVVVAMALMVGTVSGFILADTVGLFGVTLPAVTGWAHDALATELVSTALLALVLLRQAGGERTTT